VSSFGERKGKIYAISGFRESTNVAVPGSIECVCLKCLVGHQPTVVVKGHINTQPSQPVHELQDRDPSEFIWREERKNIRNLGLPGKYQCCCSWFDRVRYPCSGHYGELLLPCLKCLVGHQPTVVVKGHINTQPSQPQQWVDGQRDISNMEGAVPHNARYSASGQAVFADPCPPVRTSLRPRISKNCLTTSRITGIMGNCSFHV
jgi:hypothetical protein